MVNLYTDEDIKRWEKEAEEKYKLEDVQTEYLDGEKMSEQDRLNLLEYDRAMYVDGKIFENTDEEVWLKSLEPNENDYIMIEFSKHRKEDDKNKSKNKEDLAISKKDIERIRSIVNSCKNE